MYSQEDDIAKVIDACAFFVAGLMKVVRQSIPDEQARNQLPKALQDALESPSESFDCIQQETVNILLDVLLNHLTPPTEAQSVRQMIRETLRDIYFGRS